MIQFNKKGLLIPDTAIPSSIEELKQYFVDAIPSASRLENFEKYVCYSDALKQLLNAEELHQWIDGSFVTRKQHPQDIDLVTFIDYRTIQHRKKELMDFGAVASKLIYGVDAYIIEAYPEDHSGYPIFQYDRAYWIDRFDKTRRDRSGRKHPKGFLEIFF